jgi:F0F1-type ATP synthase membrane subunit b/b'
VNWQYFEEKIGCFSSNFPTFLSLLYISFLILLSLYDPKWKTILNFTLSRESKIEDKSSVTKTNEIEIHASAQYRMKIL